VADTAHMILHVPKCAGRTVENHLQRHLGARFWSTAKRTRSLPLGLFGRKYALAPPGPIDNVVAVSGHLLGRSVEQLFPDRRIVRSVILRDPQKQMLSWYNFRMMRYIKAGLVPYSFDLFLRSTSVDPVAHFLLERWLELPWYRIAALSAAEKAHLLDTALAEFDRVVDISEADNLIAWHSTALGLPAQAVRANSAQEWERRTGWQSVRLADLQPALLDELNDRVQLDVYLWRRWALKQNVVLDAASCAPFFREELSRMVPQLRRRVARRYGWGTGLRWAK
jgi:hypothetical protein